MQPVNVIVLGDITVDTLIFHNASDDKRQGARYTKLRRFGGSLLITEMLEKSLSSLKGDIHVFGYSEHDLCRLQEADPVPTTPWQHRITRLALFPRTSDGDSSFVHRAAEHFDLEREKTNRAQAKVDLGAAAHKLVNSLKSARQNYFDEPCVIVINDKALEFRELDFKCLDGLTKGLKFFRIVLAMEDWHGRGEAVDENHEEFRGNLWKKIVEKYADNTVVIVTAATLRENGISIRRIGPIEEIADDLASHGGHPFMQELRGCRHLIVSLDNYGCLHWEREKVFDATLHYCPFVENNLDGFVLMRQCPQFGTTPGTRSILIASVATELAYRLSQEPLIDPTEYPAELEAIKSGLLISLTVSREHLKEGFSLKKGTEPYSNVFEKLGFRGKKYRARGKRHDDKKTMLASVQVKLNLLPRWSCIGDIVKTCESSDRFEKLLIDIVKHGMKKAEETLRGNGLNGQEQKKDSALSKNLDKLRAFRTGIPYSAFGKLLTADRHEIASYLDVYSLMRKYITDKTWKTPLSIAVFGPPGSGKSFTVKELVKTAQNSVREPIIYNLSQFVGMDDLVAAFHHVQDLALEKDVPLIIFDEFDAIFQREELGWLKYFLEPMQDGKFRGHNQSYQVGRAIFVFAGGTNKNFEEFRGRIGHEQFKHAKLPDFISRLRGYLDIQGIDSEESEITEELMFRRAILLRNLLEGNAEAIFHPEEPKRLNIDDVVVQAFLKIQRYTHGARSMEAIIQTSQFEKGRFRASSLPSRGVLNMHVNADEFLHWANQMTLGADGDDASCK